MGTAKPDSEVYNMYNCTYVAMARIMACTVNTCTLHCIYCTVNHFRLLYQCTSVYTGGGGVGCYRRVSLVDYCRVKRFCKKG